MKVLLDTHVIIWLSEDPQKLTQETLNLLGNTDVEVFYSIGSIWEIAIKSGIGRITLNLVELIEYLKEIAIMPLVIKEQHLLMLANLPLIHKDPFDRLLIAQSITENLRLFTRDTILHQYSKKLVHLV